jgi:hypothetical protein
MKRTSHRFSLVGKVTSCWLDDGISILPAAGIYFFTTTPQQIAYHTIQWVTRLGILIPTN